MKPAILCLFLLAACDLEAARNYRTYRLAWTCLSIESCERTEQLALIDRAKITNGSDFIDLSSSRDTSFREDAQFVPSDALPPECSWLYGLVLFTHELEPFRFCRISDRFELELSIPNQDPMAYSMWLVEGQEIDP